MTATREMHEETGLEIEITGFLGIWLDDYPDPKGDAHLILKAFYHAVVIGGRERPDPAEVGALGWFRSDALPTDDLAFPAHVPLVLTAWRQALATGRTVTPLADRPL